MISPPLISAIILIFALILFVSEKVRHDLVALAALLACILTGLVSPSEALSGFADPAVIAVASVLVVGRALELTGIASRVASWLMPPDSGFVVRLSVLMAIAALLSAFMNNIAALVITMPLATEIARDTKRPASATLMPLAFATILGGMTTLIGTPANLILSSVREKALGEPFGFFTMAPVGTAVCVVGLLYLALVGWRFLPHHIVNKKSSEHPWQVFELQLSDDITMKRKELSELLRKTTSRLMAFLGGDWRIPWPENNILKRGDRLLLLSRSTPRIVAHSLPLDVIMENANPHHVTVRAVVAHGSPLIGEGHDAIRLRSNGLLSVIAAGPRAAALRHPLSTLTINTGDQLYILGLAKDIAAFAAKNRLLEINRNDQVPVNFKSAAMTVAIFSAAIAAAIMAGISPAISFLAAAALIAALKLIPAEEVYSAIDWSVIVLLAAMIPVGTSFQTSGAAAIAAEELGHFLVGMSLPVSLGAVCVLTLLLSIFLNNVATTLIMGPLAIKVAFFLGINPDAMLLAVLIGASSDFLTPIGHQNNLLVMGPGGYRFSDYSRMGALLALLVVITTSLMLSWTYG